MLQFLLTFARATIIHVIKSTIQSVLSNSPPVGKGSLGGLLERMDYYREQFDYYSTRMWSILHRTSLSMTLGCLRTVCLKFGSNSL